MPPDEQGPYSGFRKTPADHVREAERVLVDHGPDAHELAAMDWPTSIAYANALIALARAQVEVTHA